MWFTVITSRNRYISNPAKPWGLTLHGLYVKSHPRYEGWIFRYYYYHYYQRQWNKNQWKNTWETEHNKSKCITMGTSKPLPITYTRSSAREHTSAHSIHNIQDKDWNKVYRLGDIGITKVKKARYKSFTFPKHKKQL